MENRREKRLRGDGHAGARQRSAKLHALRQGLHSGRLRDVSEQIACRRRCRVLRQAEGRLQGVVVASSYAEAGGVISTARKVPGLLGRNLNLNRPTTIPNGQSVKRLRLR